MKPSFVVLLAIVLTIPALSVAAKQKKGQRGMLESMQSVPCGAKQRGITGLGSMMGSLGVEHVNSHEQLCPQYLLRTDDMDYHIRPMDQKHAAVLPIGQEAEFKIKKDRLLLKVADGKDKKERAYQVVAMQPVSSDTKVEGSAYHLNEKTPDARVGLSTAAKGTDRATDNPPQH